MFKNYLKTTLRNLLKNRLTTGVNLVGLALGMACVLLTFTFVRHELSFDRFHAEARNIYRLTVRIKHINLFCRGAGAPRSKCFVAELELRAPSVPFACFDGKVPFLIPTI